MILLGPIRSTHYTKDSRVAVMPSKDGEIWWVEFYEPFTWGGAYLRLRTDSFKAAQELVNRMYEGMDW